MHLYLREVGIRTKDTQHHIYNLEKMVLDRISSVATQYCIYDLGKNKLFERLSSTETQRNIDNSARKGLESIPSWTMGQIVFRRCNLEREASETIGNMVLLFKRDRNYPNEMLSRSNCLDRFANGNR